MTPTCSNIQRNIRALGLIPSNIQVNYHYHADDSGYTVARFHISGQRDLVTIIGRFPDIHAGQTVLST
jgi:hypothetical protein